MSIDYKQNNPWKKDTFEMEGNFKLAICATNYLQNPNEETLNQFKEELEVSSSLSMASVISYLNNMVASGKNVDRCKVLIDLILPKFEPEQPTTGYYDPMLGEIIYPDKDNKKMNM